MVTSGYQIDRVRQFSSILHQSPSRHPLHPPSAAKTAPPKMSSSSSSNISFSPEPPTDCRGWPAYEMMVQYVCSDSAWHFKFSYFADDFYLNEPQDYERCGRRLKFNTDVLNVGEQRGEDGNCCFARCELYWVCWACDAEIYFGFVKNRCWNSCGYRLDGACNWVWRGFNYEGWYYDESLVDIPHDELVI